MATLLTRRAVLQAAMETSYNAGATFGVNDGILVETPDYKADPELLNRNFTRDTLSQQAHVAGRTPATMDFVTELRGNGIQNSGAAAQAPIITRLFRACGYKLTAYASPNIFGVFDIGDHANKVAWSVTSGAAATDVLTLTVNAANNDTVTIGAQVYTFKTVLTGAAYEVLLGASNTATLDNLVAAVMGAAGAGATYGTGTVAHPDVTAVRSTSTMVATARIRGTAANSIVATKTGVNPSWATATLTGGLNIGTNTDVIAYRLKVTTGGASGVAQIAVASDTPAEVTAAAAVTTGSPFVLGTKGLTITPVFTGNLALGQEWNLWLMPTGIRLDPISDNFESIALGMYKDKLYHSMPGAFGTFEITAEAGKYATIKWTFHGTFVPAAHAATMPSPVYEKTLPSMVELARLNVDSFQSVVSKFSFNQANDIQLRPDVSSAAGYIGTRIVNRNPSGGMDPEADLIANHDFWLRLRQATRMPFQMRVGTQPGNTVWFAAPVTQYTKTTYADRTGLLTYDAGLDFSGYQGDDEVMLYFC
jgi:hypothetical protein